MKKASENRDFFFLAAAAAVVGRETPSPTVVDLAVPSRRVHEIETSASETGGGDVVRAVGFMAAKLTVTVMIHTDQSTASCEFVGAEFAVAVEVHSLHSGSVSAGFVSL